MARHGWLELEGRSAREWAWRCMLARCFGWEPKPGASPSSAVVRLYRLGQTVTSSEVSACAHCTHPLDLARHSRGLGAVGPNVGRECLLPANTPAEFVVQTRRLIELVPAETRS